MTRELKPEESRAVCDPATLPFDSPAELPPLDGMIGQDLAVSATAFGIGMRRPGYNLFVVGVARTQRTSTMHRVLPRTAREEPTPSDYCYAYNFADPYRPAALLPLAGGDLKDRPVGVPARAVRGARLDALQARTPR